MQNQVKVSLDPPRPLLGISREYDIRDHRQGQEVADAAHDD